MLSRLEKKYDETLTEYFRAFMAMCKRQCGIRLMDEENEKMLEFGVDRLPEERARRVLERVDLLNRLRNDVLPNPGLKDALALALPSKDMPDWWIPGKHDHDLLLGVGRHGLGRTDYYILYDPELNFRDVIRRHTAGEPLITKEEKVALEEMYYKKKESSKPKEEETKKSKEPEEISEENNIPSKEDQDTEEVKDEKSKDTEEEQQKESEKDTNDSPVKEKEGVNEEAEEMKSNQDEKERIPEKETATPEKETTNDGEEEEKMEGIEDGNSEAIDDIEASEQKSEEEKEVADSQSNDVDTSEENVEEHATKEEGIEAEASEDGQENPENTECKELEKSSNEEPESEDEVKSVVKEEIKTEPDAMDLNDSKDADVNPETVKCEIKEEVKPEPSVESKIKDEEMDVEESKETSISSRELKVESKKENDSSEAMEKKSSEEMESTNTKETNPDDKAEHSEDTKTEKSDKKDAKGSALISLQQMDEAMAKYGNPLTYDNLISSEPTVAQLLAQSAANPIKWPKDRILQTRIEHIMFAVEHKKWPVSIDFQSSDQECKVPSSSSLPQSASSASSLHTTSSDHINEADRQKRRQIEQAEADRQRLQALLHPNLHHTLGLTKGSSGVNATAAAAAAAALGLGSSFTTANLRTLMESNEDRNKKSNQQTSADTSALRQLQALQGSLDLTIKPVTPGHSTMDMAAAGLLQRRGPGRPRLDDPLRNLEKRRLAEAALDSRHQEKKRRKLDEIVLGLSSKSKTPEVTTSGPADSSPLSLLRGSSVTLLSAREKSQVTNAVTTPKLSSSISITPTVSKRPADSWSEEVSASSSKANSSTDKESKPGLVKQSDLPPGVTLPPGIELYRPADAKVDKWLEQHQGLLGDSSRPKEAKRRKTDLSALDWSQLSGDEHINVVNTATGQRVSGQEAPKLKYLAQWLIEHPNYDVDPQWVDNVKERNSTAGLLSELQKRHTVAVEKKHSSSRASILPTSSAYHRGSSPSSSATTASLSLATSSTSATGGTTSTSLPSYHSSKGLSFDPKSLLQSLDPKNHLAAAALAGLDPKLLGFDPKLSSGLDPKVLGFDPKLLPPLDPKLLAAMGIDPKLLGLDTKHHENKHHESKHESKPSSSSSSRASESKSSLHNIDLKLLGLDPKLLASLDPKALAGLDPKLLASLIGFDPKSMGGHEHKNIGGLDHKSLGGLDLKSLGGLDPKLLAGLDPKLLAALDPKVLAGLDLKALAGLDAKVMGGLDPKLLGLDPKLMGGLDLKALAGLDTKAFGGFDPKLLAGLDPKMLGLDPKMLGLDPKMYGGIDPKLFASMDPKLLGGLDPKLLASMGMDQTMMMMAGFGGLPGMAGLGMTNPLLGGLAGFGLPGLHSLNDVAAASKSKDHRNAASSSASLAFPGLFPGVSTAGLMYPPLGLGGLGSFQLPSMSSAGVSSTLLNGLPASIMSMAGTSRHSSPAPTTISSSSKWRDDQRRSREPREEHRSNRSDRSDRDRSERDRSERDRSDHGESVDRSLNLRKERLKEQSGLSKEERYLLKQMKAERLAREIEAQGGHEPYAAYLDLSLHKSVDVHKNVKPQETDNVSSETESSKPAAAEDAQNLSTKEVENGERSGTNSEHEEEEEEEEAGKKDEKS
ncbi:hypothetical protein SK128_004343 [Halocaridina rubra]|uniref:BRK domain-containing protein n=1 Tax=Halocaridina rubra TaxID=373956 RepID=A0AAN8XAV1_HALRR